METITREIREEIVTGPKYREVKTIAGHQYEYERWLEETWVVEIVTTRTLKQRRRRSKYIAPA